MAKIKNIKNAKLVINALLDSNINNRFIHYGILCIIAKESGFDLKEESGYSRTSNERILKIFGRRLPKEYHENEEKLNILKKAKEKFFNMVYKNRGGNSQPGDGYKYRGRGFNQLTFKSNYRNYSTDKYNLVKHPELLNDPQIAAEVAVVFFKKQMSKHSHKFLKYFDIESLDQIDNFDDALLMMANLNAGAGKNIKSLVVKRAYKNASKYKEQIIQLYKYERGNK